MFKPVAPNVSFPEVDKRWLSAWKKSQVFEKTLEGRDPDNAFVFYEGPPTANGMPHPGHVLTRVMKDVFLRYRTMTGHQVPRRAGWDTHGLPVEVEVEKELGISGREAIAEYGVAEFAERCISSVFRYIEHWQEMTERIGFWVDLEDAYVTFHHAYVESVWWALSELYKRGLLYQDYKVLWWWPQGGTALSAGEVGQGYKTVDDPSIYVRFRLEDLEDTSLLAWTTTPWTLPSNVGLAVDEKLTYVEVQLPEELGGDKVILAEALLDKALGLGAKKGGKKKPEAGSGQEPMVLRRFDGKELVGKRYAPIFRYMESEGGDPFRLVHGDFVTTDAGTGIVHIAPAFGEDDFKLAKQEKLGFLQLIAPDGTFIAEAKEFEGRFCKDADRDIIRHLKERGVLLREEVYRHEYPFCWRKDSDPLIQYARRSWFIRTTEVIDQVIENNQHIGWNPENIREGRFGSFLRGNVDWALSRERFWGTPLPIWVNDETGEMDVVASAEDILARNPKAFDAFDKAREQNPELPIDLRVHRPWVDEVTWQKPGEPGTYRRVPEVIDCWFDSGCMPFAQWGYPHKNKEAFDRAFPADFITEGVDQTRGWFYSLLAISTLLFPKAGKPHPFKNCVVIGIMSDEKGQKLSKSKRNYEDPMVLIDKHGADAVRWALFANTVPGQNTRFFETAVTDAVREFLLKVWNVYGFFVTYANIDAWKPEGNAAIPPSERPDLDRWILAELDSAVREIRSQFDSYQSHLATRRLESFVDALSNWYVRRSRARFWSGQEDHDKRCAFQTLYEVLVDLAKVSAPFTPFLADELYDNLVDGDKEVSVHLTRFPEPSEEREDEALRADMDIVRTVVTLGQRARAEQKVKVRQPLAEAIVVVESADERARIERFSDVIKEELNVHALRFAEDMTTYVDLSLHPNFRRLGPRLGQNMPLCKKALAGCDAKAVYANLSDKGNHPLQVGEQTIALEPEDIEVRLQAKESFAAAQDRGRVVVLDTRIDEALRKEGLAREVINRVQRARKNMDLAYETRIRLHLHSDSGELQQSITAHADYIKGETLAAALETTAPTNAGGHHQETVHIEDTDLSLWLIAV